jgi:prepilin-type N-terminal cleavage/methylation domain-containing protein
MRAPYPRRGGFTLIELLVAMSILVVLAALALLVANSGVIGNARTSSGSDRIAGWLMQAREKAKRDNAPRGIRFLADPSGSGYIREAQLIEVPEPYVMPVGNTLLIEQSGGVRRIYVIGPNIADIANNVGPNDTLAIPSLGTIHRITGTPAATVTIAGNPVTAVEIQVADPSKIPSLGAGSSAAGTPTYATAKFGFIRQARPTFGEPPLLVPDTVAICINPNNPDGSNSAGGVTLSLIPAAGGNFDVLFAPNGEVLNAGGLGRVVLWTVNPEAVATLPNAGGVRAGGDVLATYEAAGEMRHVVVYTKTGAVAVQPVSLPRTSPHDPYENTKDGIGSGL